MRATALRQAAVYRKLWATIPIRLLASVAAASRRSSAVEVAGGFSTSTWEPAWSAYSATSTCIDGGPARMTASGLSSSIMSMGEVPVRITLKRCAAESARSWFRSQKPTMRARPSDAIAGTRVSFACAPQPTISKRSRLMRFTSSPCRPTRTHFQWPTTLYRATGKWLLGVYFRLSCCSHGCGGMIVLSSRRSGS